MIQAQFDALGQAGMDYFLNGQRSTDIKVWSDIAENDTLPVHYLFRSYLEMPGLEQDRKSTRLNSSHVRNSYAVFCLKKKNTHKRNFGSMYRIHSSGRPNT